MFWDVEKARSSSPLASGARESRTVSGNSAIRTPGAKLRTRAISGAMQTAAWMESVAAIRKVLSATAGSKGSPFGNEIAQRGKHFTQRRLQFKRARSRRHAACGRQTAADRGPVRDCPIGRQCRLRKR